MGADKRWTSPIFTAPRWDKTLRDAVRVMSRCKTAGEETPPYVVRELNRQGVIITDVVTSTN
jgi:hypothetical protein